MKKVLIVSPHFPPINAPDMQRVRLALPFLRAQGWEPTVLAVAAESVEGGVRDPLLASTFPSDIRVVRVNGLPPRLTRWAGFGSLWWRCGGAVTRAGEALLGAEKFDLVFFSTTKFDAFKLGPRWQRRFGVPFVLDYQDPWVNDYYDRTGTRPPGGRLKYALAQSTARRAEPAVLRAAAGIVSVSDAYAQTFARHYPWFDAKRVRTLPFGAAAADFTALGDYRPTQPLVDFTDGKIHHVYAGRCGPDMELALSVVFRAFKRFRETHPVEAAKIQFDFIGTDYAPPPLGRDWARPVAEKEGVGDAVREHRYRVPYFDALYYLCHAQALLAVGSDDPTYSASKIFPYVLARRPLLLVFHHSSLVMSFGERAGVGRRFAFESPADQAALVEDVHARWFVAAGYRAYVPFDEAAFAPYTAEAMTAQLAEVFNAAARR
ncbi:MAG TPA: glycosyltransferase [Opitutaceae bacterium]|nr:glycosyltransferase [Opitutaceae bacterium]